MKRSKPSVMTPKVEKRILWLLKKGLSLARTLELCEIKERTFYKHREANPEFFSRLQDILILGEGNAVQRIADGAKGWQGAAWLLGKKYPDRYGKKVDEAPPNILPVRILVDEAPATVPTKSNESQNKTSNPTPEAEAVPH